MSYGNQPDHKLLDRQIIRETLLAFANATVEVSSAPSTRAEHLAELKTKCESTLETEWLNYLEAKALRLPTAAQKYFPACETRPDFMYEDQFKAAIYVDGPPHDYPERQTRDHQQESMMEDKGFVVIRFRYYDDWDKIVAQYPSLFGVNS
jgi:very-short-patch-repair endonuclease